MGYYTKNTFKIIFRVALIVIGLILVIAATSAIFSTSEKSTPPQPSNVTQGIATPLPEPRKTIAPPKLDVKGMVLDSEAIQKNWRENMVAINQAYGVQLSKHAESPDAQAKVRADHVRYERARDQHCGTIPSQVIEAFDDLPLAALDENAISTLLCHIVEGKNRLRTLSVE